MRAEMVLAVRDKLLGPLRRNRQELRNVGREARQMGAGMDRATRASAGFTRGQRQAAQEARRANRTYQQQERILGRLEQRYRNLRNKRMMQGAGLAAGGATATYAGARATMAALRPARGYGTFDEQADAVAAIARVTAGGAQDKALRSNARELGASTSFSAMQASQGQEYLALAGFKPDAIIASMRSVLDMAKAGRVEISQAADIASDVGSMFGVDKTAEGMGRLSDVLIGTTTRANTNVSMLFETLKYAGPMARQFGTELETVSAMAGVMADNGVKGSMAGTALQSMFSRLADPPKEAADALKSLGVKTADSAGNMRPIVDVLTDINEAASKLQGQKRIAALTAISGLEGAKGFLNIVSDEGLARVRELVRELAKTKGEASEMAERLGDNLPGDVKSFSSAMSELGLVIGEQVAPTLRELIQGATRLVRKLSNWANENPRLVKTLGLAAIALGAFVTAGGALATVLGTGLVGLAATRFALQMLGLRAVRSRKSVTGLRGSLLGLGRTKPLRWAKFIPPIRWLALAGALTWAVLVGSEIDWGRWINPANWGELVGQLSWGDVITAVSLASFILPFSWTKAMGRLSWRALIPPLKWGVRFIPVIGWAALAGTLAWNLLIKPLGWDKYINKEGFKAATTSIADWLQTNHGAVEAVNAHASALDGLSGSADGVIARIREMTQAEKEHIQITAGKGMAAARDLRTNTLDRMDQAAGNSHGRNKRHHFIEGDEMVEKLRRGEMALTAVRDRLKEISEAGGKHSTKAGAMLNILPDLSEVDAKIAKFERVLELAKEAARLGPKVHKPIDTVTKPAGRPDTPKSAATIPTPRPSRPPKGGAIKGEAQAVIAETTKARSSVEALPGQVRSATQAAENTLRAVDWANHGERMMATLAQGVRNGGALVKSAVAAELAKARALLPSSNAKEGPLSNLTGNGAAILRTMAQGVNQGGDGGLARALGGKMAAPLLPQLAGAGAAVGGVPATGGGGNAAPAGGGAGASFGNITFNIYPQSADDGANQIEARLRQIMHERMND